MRALRVVGITEGGGELSVVLEDPARQERFTVPADEQLRAAARGDLTRLGQISIELESQLRPREIQARIRAGASVDQVAAAAGVPPQKIERFAYPVLLERSRTAEVAQRAHPMRADGPDSRMLADVVAHTFGLRGQEYPSAEWDSWKGDDGRWVVALSWRAGRSDNRALWTFQPGAHGGTVTAIDEHAHDLVEGLPARPLRTVGPVIDISRPDDQPPPAPEEGHELRAAASDIAARRDVSDWSRVAPEPRRPEPRRPAARPESADGLHRDPYPRSGRADEPATEWPAPQRQPEERGSARYGDAAAPVERPGRADDGRGDHRPRVDTTGPADNPAPGRGEAATTAVADVPGGPAGPAAARAHDAHAGGAAQAGDPAPPTATDRADGTAQAADPTGAADPSGLSDATRAAAADRATAAEHAGSTAQAADTDRAADAVPAAADPPAAAETMAARDTPRLAGTPTASPNGTTPPSAADATVRADNGARPSRVDDGMSAGPTKPGAPEAEAAVPSARSPQAEQAGQPEPADADAAAPVGAAPGADDTAKPDHPSPEPPAPRQGESAPQAPKRSRKGKPVMPSWDEVLLGVRSQR